MLRRFGLAVIALMVAGAISAARAEPTSSPTAEATNPQPQKSDDAEPPARDPNDVMFGYQSVEFGIDRDVIKIGRDVGKFNRIRLRVLGSDVHINDLKVSFEDGRRAALHHRHGHTGKHALALAADRRQPLYPRHRADLSRPPRQSHRKRASR